MAGMKSKEVKEHYDLKNDNAPDWAKNYLNSPAGKAKTASAINANPANNVFSNAIREGLETVDDMGAALKKAQDEQTATAGISGEDGLPANSDAGLSFNDLASNLGLDTANPTKEGQEKLKGWLGEHPDYQPGEKTNSYLNAEIPEQADAKVEETAKQNPETIPEANAYKESTMSIWDAYRNGKIDKGTRDYLMIDALANFAKNTGRSIGNVGAQFTGGTIDNNEDQSLWDSRKEAQFANEMQAEVEKQVNSPAWRKAYQEMQQLKSGDIANKIKEIQSRYSEKEIQTQLGILANTLKIGNRKLGLSDLFNEESKNAESDSARLLYAFLASNTLDGGAGLVNTAGNTIGKFLPW